MAFKVYGNRISVLVLATRLTRAKRLGFVERTPVLDMVGTMRRKKAHHVPPRLRPLEVRREKEFYR